jgi:hypothetical protein
MRNKEGKAAVQRESLDNLATFIFTMGIFWGVVDFFLGLAGSFTVNSIRLFESLMVLVFGFLLILPISIMAIWKPRLAAAALALSFFLVEAVGLADDGLRGVYLFGKKLGVPTLLLACGYAYLASLLKPSCSRDTTVLHLEVM